MKMKSLSSYWKLIPTLLFAAGIIAGCGGGEVPHDHDGDGKPDHGPGEHKHDNNGS